MVPILRRSVNYSSQSTLEFSDGHEIFPERTNHDGLRTRKVVCCKRMSLSLTHGENDVYCRVEDEVCRVNVKGDTKHVVSHGNLLGSNYTGRISKGGGTTVECVPGA